jgi:hypothetical protein
MNINVEAALIAQYNDPDIFYPAYVGRAARALISMAHAARPTAQISLPPGEVQ